jgi:hypothetical protein
MDERRAADRPVIISIICWLGFFGLCFSASNLALTLMRGQATLFHAYFAVFVVVNLAAFVGIWKMRKWGVVLYGIAQLINAALIWQIWGFPLRSAVIEIIVAAVIVGIGVSQFPKMN